MLAGGNLSPGASPVGHVCVHPACSRGCWGREKKKKRSEGKGECARPMALFDPQWPFRLFLFFVFLSFGLRADLPP